MNQFPKVKVCFSIEGIFDTNLLYKKMDMTEAKLRGIDDWPEVIKNNKDLPEELQPRCGWSIEIVEEACNDIKKPLKRMIDLLKDKVDIIQETINNNNLQHGFTVIIYESELLPEIYLSREILLFLNLLNTEIGFDIER